MEAALAQGADINAKQKGRDSEENTPLLFVIRQNLPNMVKVLLQNGARVDLADRFGVNALQRALQPGTIGLNQASSREIRELIIRHIMNLPNRKELMNQLIGENQSPILYSAIDTGNEQVVSLFMEAGASPFAMGMEANTPLQYAATMGNLSVCREVLRGMLLFPLTSKLLELTPQGESRVDACKKTLIPFLRLAQRGCPKDVKNLILSETDCVLYLLYKAFRRDPNALCDQYSIFLITHLPSFLRNSGQLGTVREEMERAYASADKSDIKALLDPATLDSRTLELLFV